MSTDCPICRRAFDAASSATELLPFCSARCKRIDLGNWLGEKYRVSRPMSEEELAEADAARDEETALSRH